VGVSAYEPPFISGADPTVLQIGNVLVIDPVIRTPAGELLWSKEAVVVTDSGYRRVGQYIDWRRPYVANYTL
jgi:hypothetical protein